MCSPANCRQATRAFFIAEELGWRELLSRPPVNARVEQYTWAAIVAAWSRRVLPAPEPVYALALREVIRRGACASRTTDHLRRVARVAGDWALVLECA